MSRVQREKSLQQLTDKKSLVSLKSNEHEGNSRNARARTRFDAVFFGGGFDGFLNRIIFFHIVFGWY